VIWQEAALTILDREVKREVISTDQRTALKASIRAGKSDLIFPQIRELTGGSKGWNKIWAGNVLYGWWGDIVTSEPIRLAAIEAFRDEDVGEELLGFLMGRWNNSAGGELSPKLDSLRRELGLGTGTERLSPAEIRYLQRINLDHGKGILIEKWRWSKQAGVAFLSDDGRETVRPEIACSRAIEVLTTPEGIFPDVWRQRLSQLEDGQEEFLIDNLGDCDKFAAILEFWGLAQRWSGGVKLSSLTAEWLRRLAVLA